MKLGIDFGTTRVVVAAADRGNYPLLPFETADGVFEWFPSLTAVRLTPSGFEYRYGWDAWQAQSEAGWTVLRSLKRHLKDAGPESTIAVCGHLLPVMDLLCGMTSALHQAIQARVGKNERLEALLGVPANANSNQRFLTMDAFRRAGFSVLGILNEPSAASIEYTHKNRGKGTILVYDLGGGTFDVSVVEAAVGRHRVVGCEGIANLGGDDFDFVLAELAVGQEELYGLQLDQLFRLLEECRRQKESLHSNSRKITVDLDQVREGRGQASIPVAEFYEHCRPLLEETVRLTTRMAEGHNVDALYVTGGASELPLVARVLKEQFGRKVKRSEYMRSATALGLAIQAQHGASQVVEEMFNRNFGVWRESEAGQRMTFDVIFPRGTRLPGADKPPLKVRRSYHPVHNIGHFRYLEAHELDPANQPAGDMTMWDEILFPFDPALQELNPRIALAEVPVQRMERGAARPPRIIEEEYQCDAAGVVSVTLRNLTAGYAREYRLARWNGASGNLARKARGGARANKAS